MNDEFNNEIDDPIKDYKKKKIVKEFDLVKFLIRVNCTIFFLIIFVFEVSKIVSYIKNKNIIGLRILAMIILGEIALLIYLLKFGSKNKE